MAVTFTLELAGVTTEQLDQVNQTLMGKLGGPPDGLICHLEVPTKSGVTVVDVWETAEQLDRFAKKTLAEALAGAGITMPATPQTQKVHALFGSGIDPTDYTALAQRFYDAFSRNDPKVLDLFTEDYVDHAEVPGIPQTREGVRLWLQMLHTAFSDLKLVPDEVVGVNGTAAVVGRLTGRHTGEFMGIPATGRQVSVPFIDYARLTTDGRCREHWGVVDQAALMTQLGIPSQAGPANIDLSAEQRA